MATKVFLNDREKSNLTETATSRLHQHIIDKDEWAIISPYVDEETESYNQAAMSKFKSQIRKLGYGFIEFLSRWVDENKQTFDEKALLIPTMPLTHAMRYGTELRQKTIIVKHDNKCEEICTTPFDNHKIGDVVRIYNLGTNTPLNIEDAKEIFAGKKSGPASRVKHGKALPFHLTELYRLHDPKPSYFQTQGWSEKLWEETSINESSVNRFRKHLELGNPIAIVSAYRDKNTKLQNDQNDAELKKFAKMLEVPVASGASIKSMFGFVKTAGGYAEGGEKGVSEMSIALITTPEREQELLNFAIAMGERYNQDSILFIPSVGEAYYVSTNNEENNWVGKKGSKVYLGRQISSSKDLIDKIGGFTKINRAKRNIKDNDIFVIGESFEFDDDFSPNKRSISNKVVSNKLKYCVKNFGQDCIKKFESSFNNEQY